jgi:hypothetical protein
MVWAEIRFRTIARRVGADKDHFGLQQKSTRSVIATDDKVRRKQMRDARRIGLFVALLGYHYGASAVYGATWTSVGGPSCQIDDGSILYGTAGAGNPDNEESANFVCPLGLGTQGDNPRVHSAVVVQYIDGNSSSPFACEVCQMFYGGSTYCSSWKYACSPTNVGGCYDSTTSYTGWGKLTFTQSDLGSNVYNQNVDTGYYVFCTVPPNVSGGSWVQAYWSGE